MAILETFEKQPGDVPIYDIDFDTLFLSDLSMALDSYEVESEEGITVTHWNVEGVVKLRVAGGTSGAKYKITVRITTDAVPAWVQEVEIMVKVKEA